MFQTEGHESHELSSDFGQARDNFPSPTLNAVETKTSRKRKLIDIDCGIDIGEAFTIKV